MFIVEHLEQRSHDLGPLAESGDQEDLDENGMLIGRPLKDERCDREEGHKQ